MINTSPGYLLKTIFSVFYFLFPVLFSNQLQAQARMEGIVKHRLKLQNYPGHNPPRLKRTIRMLLVKEMQVSERFIILKMMWPFRRRSL